MFVATASADTPTHCTARNHEINSNTRNYTRNIRPHSTVLSDAIRFVAPHRTRTPSRHPTSAAPHLQAHTTAVSILGWDWAGGHMLGRTIWFRRPVPNQVTTPALVAWCRRQRVDKLLCWALTCCKPWLKPRQTHGERCVGLRSTRDHTCRCKERRTRSLTRRSWMQQSATHKGPRSRACGH